MAKADVEDSCPSKKPKMDPENNVVGALNNITEYILTKCIGQTDDGRALFTLGKLKDREGDAIVLFETNSIDMDSIKSFLSPNTSISLVMNNDIFSIYSLDPPPRTNTIKTTVIHPATPKLINKYTTKPCYLVMETMEIYTSITQPFISCHLDHQWIYNILEGKKEQDRVLYKDDDEKDGFVFSADLKWDMSTVENLYCLAIVQNRALRSIRDLNGEHVPLLKSIRDNSLRVIKERFGVPSSQIRAFFHYQPAYYHLHVHFVHLRYQAGAPVIGKSYNINDVIQNIEFKHDYYQTATLQYYIKDGHKLSDELKKHGHIDL